MVNELIIISRYYQNKQQGTKGKLYCENFNVLEKHLNDPAVMKAAIGDYKVTYRVCSNDVQLDYNYDHAKKTHDPSLPVNPRI